MLRPADRPLGIGFMIAKALATNGAARVYILGRRPAVLQEAVSSIGTSNVEAVPCDVSSQSSLLAAASRVTAASGFVNLVVCNAGIGGPQPLAASARKKPAASSSPPTATTAEKEEKGEEGAMEKEKEGAGLSLDAFVDANLAVPMDDFTRALHVNTTAVWYTTLAFLRLLDAGNRRANVAQTAQVVVIGSIAAFNRVNTGGVAYGPSKAAAVHLVRQMAVALPRWRIRANVLCPGCEYNLSLLLLLLFLSPFLLQILPVPPSGLPRRLFHRRRQKLSLGTVERDRRGGGAVTRGREKKRDGGCSREAKACMC